MYINFSIDRKTSTLEHKLSDSICLHIICSRRKVGKGIATITLGILFWSGTPAKSEGMGTMTPPPTPIYHLYSIPKSQNSELRFSEYMVKKTDKIIYQEFMEPSRIFSCFMEGKINADQLNSILKLQGGDGITDIAVILAFVILANWFDSVQSFQSVPLPHMDPFGWFQGKHNYQHQNPSARSTLQMSNSRQISTNVLPIRTQASGFSQNGNVDLRQAFDEVNRRVSEVSCENFNCSFKRFEGLATECGEVTIASTREALSILEGEMYGHYRNARRVDYGPKVKGPDYAVEGIGQFDEITHVEIKGPVSSSIDMAQGRDGNIWRQGKTLIKKAVWQTNFWSNTTKTDAVPNIRSDAYLPEFPTNMLTIVDLRDVTDIEKPTMIDAVNNFAKNDTNLVFLNYL